MKCKQDSWILPSSGSQIAVLSSYHEFLHTDGKSGRVKQDLTFLWKEADNIFNYDHKVLGQQFICLKRHLTVRNFINTVNHIEKWILRLRVKPTSSMTIIWALSTFATPFLIRSSILPGVAITTCTIRRGGGTDSTSVTCLTVVNTCLLTTFTSPLKYNLLYGNKPFQFLER